MGKKLRNEWAELDIKTKIAYITAIIAFVIGWGLTIAGFCVPPVGEVTESILYILGQALLYAASVFGVGMYVTGSVRQMRHEIHRFIRHPEQFEQYDTDNNILDPSESEFTL